MSEVTPPPTGSGTGATGATPSPTTTSTTTSSTPTGGVPAAGHTGGGEYFNQSRVKVIGLITAGVVLIGALGGIAGVAFDPEHSDDEELVQPGESAGSLGSVGNSVTRKSLLAAAPKLPADSSGSPTPVGSASPESSQSPGATTSPTTETSPTSESSPTSSPSPSPDGGGEGVTIANTGVQVYVPPGWQVEDQGDSYVMLGNGQASWAIAYSEAGVDPSADAGQLLAQNLDFFLPPESYTQRVNGDIQALAPFGSVVSIAGTPYEALWVDNQGSFSLHGEIYLAVRQDGTILMLAIEHAPVEDWDNAPTELGDFINATFARFGGVG